MGIITFSHELEIGGVRFDCPSGATDSVGLAETFVVEILVATLSMSLSVS